MVEILGTARYPAKLSLVSNWNVFKVHTQWLNGPMEICLDGCRVRRMMVLGALLVPLTVLAVLDTSDRIATSTTNKQQT
jgi:hypothetical protein